MNRDDVIRMAREAGIPYDPWPDSAYNKNIERFAALVAAAAKAEEREACAKVCEEDGLLWGQRYAAAIRARGQTP